jgi:hypothetical protein
VHDADAQIRVGHFHVDVETAKGVAGPEHAEVAHDF